MPGRFSLHIVFRHQGFKWPLRDDDTIQVWTDGHELVTTVPARVIRHLVELHLANAAVQDEFRGCVRPPVKMASRTLRPFDAQRAAFRVQRRSRKPRGGTP